MIGFATESGQNAHRGDVEVCYWMSAHAASLSASTFFPISSARVELALPVQAALVDTLDDPGEPGYDLVVAHVVELVDLENKRGIGLNF